MPANPQRRSPRRQQRSTRRPTWHLLRKERRWRVMLGLQQRLRQVPPTLLKDTTALLAAGPLKETLTAEAQRDIGEM